MEEFRFLTYAIGYLFIYIAVDHGRTPETKHNLFSRDGFIQFILVTIGGTIISLGS
jgi:hypothetical protein